MEKRRILFVDDEPNVLRGLERILRGMRQTWDMVFTTDPRQALEILAGAHFDVVISDIRMPGMDGNQFLTEVMHRYPHIIRIILSGHADRELTMEAFNVTHQLLAKPCDADTIKAAVNRTLALRKLLDGNTPLKALISRLVSLPSLPSLYIQIVQELQSPKASIHTVAKIISEDQAMMAKILQVVNSAFFGLRRPISSPIQSVSLLGLDTIKSLVLTAQIFSQFDSDTLQAYSVESLWYHSTMVGSLARRIAKTEGGDEELVNNAFMAGLLHDVGKLILAANLPNIYAKAMALAKQANIDLTEAEHGLFGATHAETGAYLLGLWGLPTTIVAAVAYHHHPKDSEISGFSALTAVHIANVLSHEFAPNPRVSTLSSLDQAYLKGLDLDYRIAYWRTLCQERLALHSM